jgi:hypothetical protein
MDPYRRLDRDDRNTIGTFTETRRNTDRNNAASLPEAGGTP